MTPFMLIVISISLKLQEGSLAYKFRFPNWVHMVIPSREEAFKVLYSTHAFLRTNFKDETKEKLLRISPGLHCKRKNIQTKVAFYCLIKKNKEFCQFRKIYSGCSLLRKRSYGFVTQSFLPHEHVRGAGMIA